MSINVVIIAALALLVLVILAIIFVGRVGKFRQSSEACETQNGVCVLPGECEGPTSRVVSDYTCKSQDDTPLVCCISV